MRSRVALRAAGQDSFAGQGPRNAASLFEAHFSGVREDDVEPVVPLRFRFAVDDSSCLFCDFFSLSC